MSMVSHCIGTRFTQLIGGVMTSFYDWYADLPVASPQVFGDQTDVPESGDWWDATYLMMWGSNVPVTRTPDAHWMAEVRYRGTKVVTVSPDYADNTKFADEWLPAQAGTDAALAMGMGHVILNEFFVARRVPFFVDYVRQYTDLPFLITLTEAPVSAAAPDGGLVPGKFLTAADLATNGAATDPEDAWKTVLLDAATGEVRVPNGSLGFRHAASGEGKWNLDLEGGVPALSASAPADIVMANHVLYFWHDPAAELARIRGFLRAGGLLALGYQLRQNMPAMAQRRFPTAGHRLYEADDEVTELSIAAGFGSVTHVVKGPAEAPEGRVMLATA
jgi:nitrate reductase alpha subunit